MSIELLNSVAADKLSSVGRYMGEIALDKILQEGILRDIPVLNTIVALHQTGIEVRQQLFIKKIINFLRELSDLSLENRQAFINEAESNPRRKREFEETLLLLIERADSLEKPSILGRLLKHHILGDLFYEDVVRLAFIVDRVYICDLTYLLKFVPGVQRNASIAASLQSAGLLHFAGIDGGIVEEPDSAGVIYSLNEYGEMLLSYGFDQDVKL